MVVRKDERRGVVLQRLAHDLARMDAGTVDGAAEHFLEMNEPVPVIQVQAAEDFVWTIAKLRREELTRGRGGIQGGARTKRLAVVTARELEGGHEGGVARGPKATQREQAVGFTGEQAPQAAAKVLKKLPGYVQCIRPSAASAQNHGQQLGVGQGVGATLDQALARALPSRPMADANLLIHSAILRSGQAIPEASNGARIANNCRNYWPNQCDW